MAFYLLIAYFAFLVLISFRQGPRSKNKVLHLFRAFLPSWKFFEDMGHEPQLHYRKSKDGNSFGDWLPMLEKQERSISHVFLSPQGNLRHAYMNHLHHFISDINESNSVGELSQSASYGLTRNLVEENMAKQEGETYFQFKLSVLPPEGALSEDVLISQVHEVHYQ